jgi:hypothetical protein
MNVIEVKNPKHGAAFQILFAKVGDHWSAPERRAEIAGDLAKAVAWAASQPADILAAYKWAADAILTQIDRQAASNAMQRGVHEALKTFPRPPE